MQQIITNFVSHANLAIFAAYCIQRMRDIIVAPHLCASSSTTALPKTAIRYLLPVARKSRKRNDNTCSTLLAFSQSDTLASRKMRQNCACRVRGETYLSSVISSCTNLLQTAVLHFKHARIFQSKLGAIMLYFIPRFKTNSLCKWKNKSFHSVHSNIPI